MTAPRERHVELGPCRRTAVAVHRPTARAVAAVFLEMALLAWVSAVTCALLVGAALRLVAVLLGVPAVGDVLRLGLFVLAVAAGLLLASWVAWVHAREVIAVGTGWLSTDGERRRWVCTERLVVLRRRGGNVTLRDDDGREVQVWVPLLWEDAETPMARQFAADLATSLDRGLVMTPEDLRVLCPTRSRTRADEPP